MIERKSLIRATLIGTVLQIAMAMAGHYSPWVALHVFMIGGMSISALAGLLYARAAAKGFVSGGLGGAIAGAFCALLGIAVSVGLGDTIPAILGIGTAGSAVTGLIGGLAGQAITRAK